jgi:NAD dependent epimerase/dehydratase family enzyme
MPEFLLRLITGEFATVFVNGQRVIPGKLLASGYSFKHSTLENAIQNLLL